MIARIAEVGFVSPGPVRAQRPDEPYQLRFVDGLATPVQYFVVGVGDAEIVVVTAEAPELAGAFAGKLVVTRNDERAGWARATPGAGVAPEQAAIAVAAVKAIAGWDETIPIVVELGPRTLRVFLAFEELQWHARVEA